MITGQIQGQSLRLVYPTIAADTVGYLEAEFTFSSEDWDGLVKWAHFRRGDEVYDVRLTDGKIGKGDNLNLGEGDWEVYLHGNSVVGGEVITRITTVPQRLTVHASGVLEGQPLPDIPLTAAEQIMGVAEEALSVAETLRADADNGVFDGEKGDKGDKGDTGDKGEKGDTGAPGEVTLAYAREAFGSALRETRSGGAIVVGDAAFLGEELSITSLVTPVQASGTPSPDNVLPITGYTGAVLTRCGKNLLPYPYYETSKTENGVTFTDNGDGSITVNGTATADVSFRLGWDEENIIKVSPTTPMFMSGCPAGGDNSTYFLFASWIGARDGGSGVALYTSRVYPDRWAREFSIEIKSGTTANNLIFYPQVEVGTEATAYEPYREKEEFMLDFGETVYGGTVNWNTGVLTVDRGKHICSESDSWRAYDTMGETGYEKQYRLFNLESEMATDNKAGEICDTLICSRYATIKGDEAYLAQKTGIAGLKVTNSLIYVYDENYAAKTEEDIEPMFEAFKASMVGAEIVYGLKYPYTIQLTPHQLKAVAGINTVFCDTGDSTVTYNRDINAAFAELWQALAAITTSNDTEV